MKSDIHTHTNYIYIYIRMQGYGAGLDSSVFAINTSDVYDNTEPRSNTVTHKNDILW